MNHYITKYILAFFTLAFCAVALAFFCWYQLFSIPKELTQKNAIRSIQITDRNGLPLRETLSATSGRQRWVALNEISPNLISATIIAEDKRFYRHNGVDLLAIARAIVSNIRAKHIVSGGSTITEQLVRLLRQDRRTLGAKVLEAILAQRIEQSLSKDEILEQYLNRAPYGNQLFGVEAASQMYFGKPSSDLSISESAFLAILPRAPSAFDPYRNFNTVANLYRKLIQKMSKEGRISSDAMQSALRSELKLLPKRAVFLAPHFIEMLRFPNSHGATIRTSLDLRLQTRIENIVDTNLRLLERYNVTNAAVVVLDNRTGEIIALVGSRDYNDIKHAGNVNGAMSRRQPGSALKPFTYALALDKGFTAASILPDIELHFPTENGDYTPKNYDLKYRGPVRLRMALANSLNVPAVFMLSKLGTQELLLKLHELGFKSLDKGAEYYGLGLTLGNGEVTLLELANAYSTLARGGIYIPTTTFPDQRAPEGKKIFSNDAAYIISDILSDNSSRRMSFGEDSPLNFPFRVAAKTGTSKNFRDNWAVGYTPEVTVAVWVGNFDADPMHGTSGITGAAPIFRDVFLEISKNMSISWFDEPKNILHHHICPLSGQIPTEICGTEIEEIFKKDTEPKKDCAFHKEHLIDTRNNLLAEAGCSSKFVSIRSFIDLPDNYRDWAMTHDITLMPKKFSPLCPMKGVARAQDPQIKEEMIRITYPNNNSTYSVDPYVPRRLQILDLRATAEGTLNWFLDGEKLATTTAPHSVPWQITAGKHKFRIESMDNKMKDEIEIIVNK